MRETIGLLALTALVVIAENLNGIVLILFAAVVWCVVR